MHLYFDAVTPQGVSATVHKVTRVDASDTGVQVHVMSYAHEEAELPVWNDIHTMPTELFTSYPASAYDWLKGEGGPLNGAVLIPGVTDLVDGKLKRKKLVDQLRVQHEAKGLDVTGIGIFDTDPTSIRNINATYTVAQAYPEREFGWRLADNSVAMLTAAQMIQVGNAVLAHVEGCYAHSWALKAQIDAAEHVAELEGIDVYVGWPE